MGNTIQENVEWLKKETLSDWITKINNIEISKILVNYNEDLVVDIGSDNDIKSIKNKIGKIKETINQKFNILPELINSAKELRDFISSILSIQNTEISSNELKDQLLNKMIHLNQSLAEQKQLNSSIENDIKKTIDSDNINKLIIEIQNFIDNVKHM